MVNGKETMVLGMFKSLMSFLVGRQGAMPEERTQKVSSFNPFPVDIQSFLILLVPRPFEVEVFVSGYAISYRPPGHITRSQRAFIRLAKGSDVILAFLYLLIYLSRLCIPPEAYRRPR